MSPLSFGLGSSRAFGIASSRPAGPWSVIYDFSDSACYSGSGNTIIDLEGKNNKLPFGLEFKAGKQTHKKKKWKSYEAFLNKELLKNQLYIGLFACI